MNTHTPASGSSRTAPAPSLPVTLLTPLLRRFWQGLLILLLGMSGAAQAGTLNLTFSGGTAGLSGGGGACGLIVGSQCRYSNVVQGNPPAALQRDAVITVTSFVGGASLASPFDNDTVAYTTATGTAITGAHGEVFAPIVVAPDTAGVTSGVLFTITFYTVGTTTLNPLPGTVFVTSSDTDTNGALNGLREYIEFRSFSGTGLPGTTNLLTTVTGTGTQYTVKPAAATPNIYSVGGITVDPAYRASARYDNPGQIEFLAGAIQGSDANACDTTVVSPPGGSNACNRLGAYSFQMAESTYTTPVVDVYKSVKLTTDADGSGSITPNDTLTYTLTAVNTGNAAVTNFQLTDTLPTNVTITGVGAQTVKVNGTVTAGARNATYTGLAVANTLLAAAQTLAVAGTISVDIPVKVGVILLPTTLSNQGAATGTGISSTNSDNVDTTTAFPPSATAATGWTAVPAGSVTQTQTATLDPTTATITPVADLAITKTDGVTSVNAGGTTTYTIRVTNGGPGSVTGATLTDAAVTGLNVTTIACSGTPGQCTAGTTPTVAQLQAGYALPTLASGQFYELTVTGTVTATSGSVANTATIAAPSGTTDLTTGNNTATDTDTVTPVADLTLTKTDGVTSVNASGTTTYTVTLTNNGPSSAGGTVLTDPVASGLNKTSVSCSAAGGAACPAITTSTLESGVTIATLPAGGSITLTIAASVTATSGSVTNSVTAALPGGTTDLTPTGTVSDTDTVTPVANLSITKTDGVSSVSFGASTTYTIRVTNGGPSSVTGATLADAAVSGLNVTTVACSGTPGQCTAGTTPTKTQLQAGYTLPALASGQFYELTVTGTMTRGGSVANTATVAAPSGTTDPTPGNNSATDTDTVVYSVVCSKVYASSFTTGRDQLYELNGANMVSVYTAPQTVGGLAISANGSAYYDDGTFTNPPLYRFNGSVQTNTTLTLPTLLVGEAADAAGNVYFLDGSYHLRRAVAGSSGPATDLGALIFDAGDTVGPTLQYGDLTFDGNGRLEWYSAVNGSGLSYLYAIDPVTLKAKSFGQMGPDGATGLAFDSSGKLITTGSGGTSVVSVDLSAPNLTGTVIGTANPAVYDLGSCAAPILNAQLSVTKAVRNVTKAANPATFAEPGDTLEYTITVANSGNFPTTDSVLTDSIPVGTTYLAGTTTLNGAAVSDASGAVMPYVAGKEVYTANQPSGVVLVGGVNAAVVKFQVKVNASGAPSSIDNQATVNYPTVSGGVSTTQTVTNPTVKTAVAPRLTLSKTIAAGRINAADQFTVQVKSGAAVTASATTSGTGSSASTGAQTLSAGTTYTLTEIMAAGSVSSLGDYTTTVSCVNSATGSVTTLPSGSGQTFTVTPALGDQITCTFTNTRKSATLTLRKTWGVNSLVGNAISVTTSGAINNATLSSVATAAGNTTTGTTVTVYAGEAITLPAETFTTGSAANYTATLTCTGNAAALPGGTAPQTLNVSVADTAITCTYTNTPVADLSITKTNGVSSVNAGGTTTYTIRITNGGPGSVTGATLTDAAVTGLNVTTIACSGTPGQCTAGTTPTKTQLQAGYPLPTLASGQFYELSVTGTVTATSGSVANTATIAAPSGTTDPTSGNNTATDTDTVTPVADLSITKTDGVGTFHVGSILTYTVVVSNAGPSTATGATVSDPLPSGIPAGNMSYTAAVSGGATTAVTGTQTGALSDTVTVPVGGTVTYTIMVTVPTGYAGGTVVNAATVTAPGGTTDPAGGNNTATDTDTREPPIANNDSAGTNPTVSVTFNVTGNDTGPVDPATVDLDPATPGQQTTFTDAGKGTYTVDSSGNVTFTPVATFVLGTSTIPYTVKDALGVSSNVATISVSVPAAADLSISKSGPAFAKPGDAITYTLTVTNTTAAAAGAYTVTDPLPTGVTFVSASNGGTYDSGARTVTWALLSLTGNASQTLTVNVTAPSAAQVAGGITAVQNTATATLIGDPVSANNTSGTVTTRLILNQITKSVRNVTADNRDNGGIARFGTSGGGKPGEVLEYCLAARNLGGVDLGAPSGYMVKDALPDNVSALLTGYDADEPSAATGYGVRVTRGAAAPTYLKSGVAVLTDTSLNVNLNVLAAGELATVCFQATIR